MPIILKGKIARVQKNADGGPLFESVFLATGSDFADPVWTRDADNAAVMNWDEACRLAPTFGGHAVVVGGLTDEEAVAPVPPAPPATQPVYVPRPVRPTGRPQRSARGRVLAQYQRTLETRKLF